MDARFSRPDRPMIWAHRGASRDAPENTLPAFLLAARQGADGVELDAQLCASGEVVVFHDVSLARVTGVPGLLAEQSLASLRRLDAAAGRDAQWRGTRIPLLAEVLAETPPSLWVNIELKCDQPADRGLTREVIRLVRDTGSSERVLLSSFNPLCLARARALAPRLPRALLFEPDSSWPLRSAASAPLLDLAALHPHHSLCADAALARWRKRYTVASWTVDPPELARDLWRRGVSGMITNRPAELLAAFAKTTTAI